MSGQPAAVRAELAALVVEDQLAALGRNLRRLHRRSGLSTIDLAQLTGLSRPTIWRTESGHAGTHLTTVVRLAAAYGLTLAELLALPPCACADGIPDTTVCTECGTNPAHRRRSGQ